jgi:hypothetical protein
MLLDGRLRRRPGFPRFHESLALLNHGNVFAARE